MEFFLIAIAGKIFSYPFNDSIFHNKSGTYNQSCCGTWHFILSDNCVKMVWRKAPYPFSALHTLYPQLVKSYSTLSMEN